TSSSSSLSLSLFSESDFLEGPSTSGYSSEMATTMRTKERKKERAKEFMKKLKSMLPHKKNEGKMDTLSTLERLVDSMRQLSENEKKSSQFKTPPPHTGSYHSVDTDKLDQSNMFISVSPKSHVVQKASGSLMEHLGYPVDWWKGRLLKDFLKKKDINTVNSCLAHHSVDDDWGENSESVANSSTAGSSSEGSKYFYARIRRFRKLGEGFNLQNIVSYCPFRMMVKSKPVDSSDVEDDGSGRHRRSLIIYCIPLTSAYLDGGVPEQNKFSLRHSLFCTYTYTDPNTVGLLGFLPQDLNGMQIFDLYHPDNLPMLLEVHKKIMSSKGQPFKSEPMKMRTRNGCYVEVETEWSSFMNPLSMSLEFIIGQHTVIKPPSSPDLFEDLMTIQEKFSVTPEDRKIQEKILDVLKKRIQNVFAEPSPVVKPVKTKHITTTTITTPVILAEVKDSDSTTKGSTLPEKSKDESSSAESKSAVLDEKGISSIYNQLNYSHNIKRFLMSHPKSFSNVSDEDSIIMRDDSEDENINEEEELPLEIPVVKPPSCGSSTQVHVSEPGHAEDSSSVAPFGDETSNPPGEVVADSRHFLTEETLKKHTKIQERLYLQRISEEQQLVLNMHRTVRRSRNTSHQKRPRPKEIGEDMDSAKQPCTKGGVFRSSSNIFMQSFPVIKENELAPTAVETDILFEQKVDDGGSFPKTYVGHQATPISFQAFPQGYSPANQGSMGVPQQPAIHLVPGEPVPISCIPTSMTTMVPTQVDMGMTRPRHNIQWPYYPQAGYTLLPQVMAGFYQPMLQPVQMNQGPLMQYPNMPVPTALEQRAHTSPQSGENGKHQSFDKKGNYCDNNQSSSMEDTTSSIMYLLDADSSTLEDSDNKHCVQVPTSGPAIGQGRGGPSMWMQNKVTMDPPWLCGINWNSDTKMRYQLPQPKMSSVLKMDEKVMKNLQQNELAQQNLEQLLEDVALLDFEFPLDEEADYIFFPGDELVDENDTSSEKIIEVEMTEPLTSNQMHEGGIKGPDKGGGGDGGGGGQDGGEVDMVRGDENGNKEDGQATPTMLESSSNNSDEGQTAEVVWTLADENAETPTKSSSEDEKADVASSPKEENKKEDDVIIKAEVKVESAEDNGDGGDVAMETDFCGQEPHASSSESSLVEKRGSSPKDGSLSGDECSGSDGGHKIEMEDAQSSCSKESSDLTPSEVRSNEEAGSSLKESDSSVKLVKGGPSRSVASPSSSTDQMVQEEVGKTDALVADLEEVFQKLFVPLKVRLSHRTVPKRIGSPVTGQEGGASHGDTKTFGHGGSPRGAPFWLLEAHMNNRVAMSYKVPIRPLEDVLMEDSRRMTDLVQSATVRQQLLQLLSEVDFKASANSSPPVKSASNPTSVISSPTLNPSTDPSANDSIPLLSVSPTAQSPPLQTDLQLYTNSDYTCLTSKKPNDADNSVKVQEKSLSSRFFKGFSRSKKADPISSMSPVPSTEENMNASEDSLAETKSQKFLSLRSMESMQSSLMRSEDSSSSPHLYREMVFSDTNSEPAREKLAQKAETLGSQSSATDTTNIGCDSTGDDSMGAHVSQNRAQTNVKKVGKQRQEPSSVSNLSKVESRLNEKFQALESNCLGEQGIEDVIMSRVFLSSESMCSSAGNTATPDLQCNIQILDE
ncbi:circadian clock protein period, partial [Elysia marginata]